MIVTPLALVSRRDQLHGPAQQRVGGGGVPASVRDQGAAADQLRGVQEPARLPVGVHRQQPRLQRQRGKPHQLREGRGETHDVIVLSSCCIR